MHWSVGMLLHAVCVFFFRGEKKKLVEKLTWGVFPNTFSSQHGAVDLDYIPFMSPLDFTLICFVRVCLCVCVSNIIPALI